MPVIQDASKYNREEKRVLRAVKRFLKQDCPIERIDIQRASNGYFVTAKLKFHQFNSYFQVKLYAHSSKVTRKQ